MKILNVLIACVESQAVCKEFRALGHNAFSCDLINCSGGHPEWHFKCDCLNVIATGGGMLETGETIHVTDKWDLIIAHPPCTFLTVSGNRWFNVEKYGEKAIKRQKDREEAIDFFLKIANSPCEHIVIENPIGVMSSSWRKPEQIIQPWQFGDPFMKTTCLWEKNVPQLKGWVTEKPDIKYKEWVAKDGTKKRQDMASYNARFLDDTERQCQRSKTFLGIAKAMATQWSEYLTKQD